jgi:hypothetical protein
MSNCELISIGTIVITKVANACTQLSNIGVCHPVVVGANRYITITIKYIILNLVQSVHMRARILNTTTGAVMVDGECVPVIINGCGEQVLCGCVSLANGNYTIEITISVKGISCNQFITKKIALTLP